MTSERNPPTGWVLEIEQTTHDELMGRDYTTVLYRQEHTRSAVYINEVIDGRNVWEYNVHHSGRDGDLGTAADLETAKQIAYAFMNEPDATV
ncbi:hypothetical protein VB773_20555 [Haloarculaceae archaeon H-GB2-1]|nr:hypothetical protein [Haloarculaceae archaeon H-GB1-1]MEA5389151.1 hypothetical protein [Haloarculaceae archaeon H-GB11]MEA5409731.1 hypothetical protein [Haloarculaceae archaeon H-GB2-1]